MADLKSKGGSIMSQHNLYPAATQKGASELALRRKLRLLDAKVREFETQARVQYEALSEEVRKSNSEESNRQFQFLLDRKRFARSSGDLELLKQQFERDRERLEKHVRSSELARSEHQAWERKKRAKFAEKRCRIEEQIASLQQAQAKQWANEIRDQGLERAKEEQEKKDLHAKEERKRVQALAKQKEKEAKAQEKEAKAEEKEERKRSKARAKEERKRTRARAKEEQERQQAREKEEQKRQLEESRRGVPKWEWDKPSVKPEDEIMLTMTDATALFKERLGVSRATFYRLYRPMLTVYFLSFYQAFERKHSGKSDVAGRYAYREYSECRGTKRAKKSDVDALILYLIDNPALRMAGQQKRPRTGKS